MAEIKTWKGLNNKTSPERFKVGELAVALDVDIDNTGKLLSRKGKTVIDGTACHSLYSNEGVAFLAKGTSMFAVGLDLSLTLLRTLSNANQIYYGTLTGVTYWTNGTDTGRTIGTRSLQWGVAVPQGQPAAALSYGSLPPGNYQYALTFLRDDGHESGTGLAGQFTLSATGGIQLSGIEVSTNPEVSAKILYLTSPNGEVMYRAVVIPNGQTVAVLSAESNSGIPLTTQFAGPPPAGNSVLIFNNVIYVVAGNDVFYSDPYNLDLFRPDTNFLRFPGPVALFGSVHDGIFVATQDTEGEGSEAIAETVFLHGDRPDKFVPEKVFGYGAMQNTTVAVEGGWFDDGSGQGPSPDLMWASRHGVCVGSIGGQAVNLTETKFGFPVAQQGAALVRKYRGFIQYVLTEQGTGASDNSYP